MATTAPNTLTIEKVGRRHYIVGDTYPHRKTLSTAGCKWDGDRGAWWTGKADVATALVDRLNHTTPSTEARPAKLDSGEWGARVTGGKVAVGDTITVVTSKGRRWQAVVTAIISESDGAMVVATREANAPLRARGRSGKRRCRATGCSATAVTRGYCERCAFDEFDY